MARADLRTLLLLLLALRLAPASGQNWMRGWGSLADDRIEAMEPLPGGDVIAVGSFSAFFDLYDTLLVTQGVTDAFVARVDALGAVVWARAIGGSGVDRALDVAVDGNGTVAIVGQFAGSMQVGSILLTSNSGSLDGFVAVCDANGNFQWAASMGSPQNADRASAVAIAPDGSVLVGGDFSHSAQIGSGNLTSAFDNLLNAPGIDVFLARYSGTGVFQWVRHGSATLEEECVSVACDNTGAAYLTGRFTDDITFQQFHPNAQDDAVFLVKFDASGNEVWFSRLAGAITNQAADVEWKGSALYLTGYQTGNTIYFGTGTTPVGSNYASSAFILEVDAGGAVQDQWSFGSDSPIGAVDLCIGDTAMVIGGWFECILSQGEDENGAGLFMSIGDRNNWVAEVGLASLQHGFVQQFGSHFPGGMNAVALDEDEAIIAAGVYRLDLVVACIDTLFDVLPAQAVSSINLEATICNDTAYGDFISLDSIALFDAFIMAALPRERSIFDVFLRDDGTCDLSYLPSGSVSALPPAIMIGDTAYSCGSTAFSAAFPFAASAAPYTGTNAPWVQGVWHDGEPSLNNYTDTHEHLWFDGTTDNGCYTFSDSAWGDVWPFPSSPYITDDQGVNTLCNSCATIFVCLPINPVLTATLPDSISSWSWTLPNGNSTTDTTIIASTSGYYILTVTNSFGCSSSALVEVILQPVESLDNLTALFEFVFPLDPDGNDTIVQCGTGSVDGNVFHTIYENGVEITSEPGGTAALDSVFDGNGVFLSTANLPITANPGVVYQTIISEGWYVWEYHYYISNFPCDSDLYLFTAWDSVYVDTLSGIQTNVYIVGSIGICPGDTVDLTAVITGAGTLAWAGDGIVGDTTATSVQVTMPGYYTVELTPQDTGACTLPWADIHLITLEPAPFIAMVPSNGLICPNDSIMIVPTPVGDLQWYGPTGPIGSGQDTLYVSAPGSYFVVLTGSAGCGQASNTVEVVNYSTPYISAFPQPVLCNGGSVTLTVNSPGDITALVWLPPLSGNALTQTVSLPGIYQCGITVCGITTVASIEVIASNLSVVITDPGPFTICSDSTALLSATPGLIAYLWLPTLATGQSVFVGPGQHSVVGFDQYGCTDTAGVAVVDAFTFTDSLQASAPAVCPGGTTLITTTGSGTITWYGDPAMTQPIGSGTPFSFGPVVSGTTVFATQTENGCTSNVVMVPLTILAFTDSVQGTALPVCPGDTAVLVALGSGSIAWYADAGATQPIGSGTTIAYGPVPNDAIVWVVQTENGCTSAPVAVEVTTVPVPPVFIFTPDTVLCEGATLLLNATPGNDGAVEWLTPIGVFDDLPLQVPNISTSHTGWYVYTYPDASDCGSAADSVFILVNGPPDPGLPPDTLICIGDVATIGAGGGFDTYAWSTGAYTQAITVSSPGAYVITVTTNEGCTGSDSIVLAEGPCDLAVPNVITPNGDGNNDIIDLDLSGFSTATFTIWNRWGQEVADITGKRITWNGRHQRTGDVVPSGTYFWTLTATRATGVVQEANGYLMVLYE